MVRESVDDLEDDDSLEIDNIATRADEGEVDTDIDADVDAGTGEDADTDTDKDKGEE